MLLLWAYFRGETMKDLKIKDGDLVLNNGDIGMVSDKELLVQKVELLLATMQGEWFLDEEEGINRELIFVKENNLDEDMLQDAVYQVLMQVDEKFELDEFSADYVNRNLTINFKAHNDTDEIEINYEGG